MFDAEHSLLVKFSLTAQITRVICTGKMKGCRADIYGLFAKILCTLMRCFWLVVKCAKLPPVTNLHFEKKNLALHSQCLKNYGNGYGSFKINKNFG